MKKKLIGIILLMMIVLIAIGAVATHVLATNIYPTQVSSDLQGGTTETGTSTGSVTTNGNGLIAAALSTGLAALGAGIAVAVVGSAALGAISENPKLLGRTIIFVGLAEGIAIYGLIISIMILSKI
ncbi:MAG: ATP synthase subunit C [Oscillospiraceae bacterium]|nr:ATP synthase subunit C [Oscillospiraceae bacterium]